MNNRTTTLGLIWLQCCAAIWWLAPHIQWDGGSTLFTNVTNRLLVILILTIAVAVCQFKPSNDNAPPAVPCEAPRIAGPQPQSSDPVINLDTLNQLVTQSFKWFKQHTSNLRFGILRRRCFLVLGQPGAGRTTLLAQSGAQPLFPDTNPQEISQMQSPLQWWQHKDMLLLSASALLSKANNLSAGAQSQHWQKLIRQLGRRRLKRPFDGILLVLNLKMLHHGSDSTELAEQLAQLNTALSQLGHSHRQIPLTVVLTHCDYIAGFQEFFGDLDPEERQQYWGICPNASLGRSPLADYDNTFADLLARLNAHLIRRIHQESHPTKRELIKDFPVQLEKLRTPIKRLLSQLNLAAPLQLQSICLTSNQQTGQCFDYLMSEDGQPQDISHTLERQPSHFTRQLSFFSKQLLDDLAYTPTQSGGAAKLSHWQALSACVLATGMVGFLSYQWYQNAQITLKTTQLLSQQLQQTKPDPEHAALSIWQQLTPIQTILDTLNARQQAWQNFGLKQLHILETSAQQRYQTLLHQTILPHLRNSALDILNDDEQSDTARYQALTAYLMLSGRLPIEFATLQHWFNHQCQDSKLRPQQLRTLHDLLAIPLPKQLVKTRAIDNLRAHLDTLNDAQKVLLQVSNSHNQQTTLKLNTQTPLFSQQTQHIASRYLASNFDNIMQQAIPKACQQLLDAPSDAILHATHVQPLADCVKQAHAAFINSRADAWLEFIENLQLNTTTTLVQAYATLDNLSSPDSELSKIITFTSTQLMPITKAPQLSKHNQKRLAGLQSAQAYLKDDDATHAWRELSHAIQAMASSDDRQQSAYQQFISPLKHPDKPDIFKQAHKALTKSPSLLQAWQQHALNDSQQQIQLMSRNYLNALWHETVYAIYAQKIAHHYPMDKSAEQDISLSDFKAFFSPDGILETYFQEFIAPLVDRDHKMHWHWKPAAKALKLNDSLLSLFMQAKLIEKMYFHYGSEPMAEFSLIPVSMKSNIKRFTLNLGGQKVILKPGDEQISQLRWPSRGDDNVNLQFTNSVGEQKMTQLNSVWGLFKLLDHAHFQPTQNGKRFQLTFSAEPYAAKFELIADQAINPFIPDILNTFSCPESLIDN